MRKLLLIIAIPLLLVVLAAVLLPLLVDKDKLLQVAIAQVHERTGATLAVDGGMQLRVLPHLGLALEEASLRMPGEETPGLRARELAIGLRLLPLLRKRLSVESIALDGVLLRVVTQPAPAPLDTSKLSDEQLQAFYARRREALEAAGRSAGSSAALAVPLALEVGRLSITDSRLEFTEAGSAGTTAVEIPSLEATDLNLAGRPMPLQARLGMPGDKPLQLALDGRLTVDQDTQAIGIEQLAVTLEGALAEPLALELSGPVDLQNQVADLGVKLATGAVKGAGKLRYASFESPQIDTTLHLNLFTPALFAVAGPEAAAQAGSGTAGGEGDVPLPLDALRVMDTRARLTIDDVELGGHRVQNLKALLRVVDGYAALPRVDGEVHGGTLAMKASLNAKLSTARVNSEGGLTGVDIAAALQAAEVQPLMTGRASLSWKLHGEGNTTHAIRDSLSGPIELTTEDAVLTAVGVEQKLCQAVAAVNQQQLAAALPDTSAFEELSATINLGQGKAKLQPLKARLPDLGLTGSGNLDLASQDFRATFNAKLAASLGDLDPACKVDERLTSIKWPLECKGNLNGEPKKWCSVDTREIVKDLATGEAKRKAQKEIEDKFGEEAGGVLKKLFGN